MPDFGSYGLTDPLPGSLDESESTFENKSGLADDMKFLASMPELCDVTFLVGETREPVCAVKVSVAQYCNFVDCILYCFLPLPLFKAILAARSRIFHKLLYHQASPQRKMPNPPPTRENKLRLFLKRSSEPLLNLQGESQKVRKTKTSYKVVKKSWMAG